jgi:hypothetical protein
MSQWYNPGVLITVEFQASPSNMMDSEIKKRSNLLERCCVPKHLLD